MVILLWKCDNCITLEFPSDALEKKHVDTRSYGFGIHLGCPHANFQGV